MSDSFQAVEKLLYLTLLYFSLYTFASSFRFSPSPAHYRFKELSLPSSSLVVLGIASRTLRDVTLAAGCS